MYLSALWASTQRQVLLIETDAAAGSLSRKLGMQFTPGTASFTAADKPATVVHLVEHSQDVLFNDMHVMPAPSNPAGALAVAERFGQLGNELRDVADAEMAVVIDAGRLSASVKDSQLSHCASAIVVVSRDDKIPGLSHLGQVLGGDEDPGPLGFVVSVEPSSLNESEWQERTGLDYLGCIDLPPDGTVDLSMFMSRGKRKHRKRRVGLEKMADCLYEHAHPAVASSSRPRGRLPLAAAATPDQDQPASASPPSAEPVPPAAADTAEMRLESPSAAERQPTGQPDWDEHHGGRHAETPYPNAPPMPPVGTASAPAADWQRPPYQPLAPQPPYRSQPPDAEHSSYAQQAPPVPYAPDQRPGPYEALPAGYPTEQPADDVPSPPTGSFRSWAAQMYGADAEGQADGDAPASSRDLPA